MYFQLEVDYCSNEAKKSKYTNFQLIGSTKKQLKVAELQIVLALYLQRQLVIFFCFDLKVLWCLDLLLLEIIFFKCKLF